MAQPKQVTVAVVACTVSQEPNGCVAAVRQGGQVAPMATEGSTRAILAAFFANLGIALAKFVAFLVTGAASMLAEAIHSVADTGNQALLILGGRQARRPATSEHPFGYGRERYFWAFLVAVVLFTVGSLFALFEGYEKLRHPHELESPAWAIGVLVVAIGLESWSLRTAVVESNKVRKGLGWWAFVRRSKTPELPVVLLEDIGAMFGLIFALVGVTLAAVTHNPRFDAMGSIAIGLLLGVIAVVLGREMRSLLIGEAAGGGDLKAIRDGLTGTEGVRRLIHLRTMHLGPDELLVAAKLELDSAFTFDQVCAALNSAEARVREAVPAARLVYLEPDAYDPTRVEPPAQPVEAPPAH
jgi:cation diffusion facilitator family transporter